MPYFLIDSVELRRKSTIEKTMSLDIANGYRRDLTTEEILNKIDYDDYGSTPPRQRIKNKNRDWDRKQQRQQQQQCKM